MVNSVDDPVLEVVSALNTSRSAAFVRRFEHGAGGTSLVRLDGRTVVLKAWRHDPRAALDITGSLARMHIMRSRGIPIPEVLDYGEIAGCKYLAYEQFDGAWPERVTLAVLEDLLAIIDAERGAAEGPCPDWQGELIQMVTGGDHLFDITPNIVEQRPTGRRLLREARLRLTACNPDHLNSGDIVHGDFAPENLLIRDDRVVGVVDWERCRVGDAAIDLAGVLFDVEIGRKASRYVRRLLWHEVRSRVPADALGTYIAIYAVRYASWAIASTMEREVLSLGVRLVAETSTS